MLFLHIIWLGFPRFSTHSSHLRREKERERANISFNHFPSLTAGNCYTRRVFFLFLAGKTRQNTDTEEERERERERKSTIEHHCTRLGENLGFPSVLFHNFCPVWRTFSAWRGKKIQTPNTNTNTLVSGVCVCMFAKSLKIQETVLASMSS